MNKTIGLFGLEFSSGNLGCCALSLSFCQLLKEILPDGFSVSIIYFSDGREKYSPPFEVQAGRFETVFYSVRNAASVWNLYRHIKKCDLVFDFTGGDSFSDIYGIRRFLRVSFTKILTIQSGTPLILGPQTYGPYQSAVSEYLFSYIAKRCRAIFARDGVSAVLAEELSGRKCKSFIDVAFALPYSAPKKNTETIRIGINVSGLLWRGGYNGKNQFALKTDYQIYIKELIRLLLSEGYEVHLIPHVITKNEENCENDFTANEELKKIFPAAVCARKFKSPVEAKTYIASMDIFTGARMHATIAAISSGVPVIPFSYSRKFEGLYQTLQYSCMIDGRKLATENALEKTINYIKDAENLKADIEKAECIYKKQLEGLREELRKAVIEEGGK